MTAAELPALRAARESVGWSRDELALASGVSRRMIRAVEDGNRRASTRTAEHLEQALLRRACSQLDAIEDAVAAVARLDSATREDSGGVRA